MHPWTSKVKEMYKDYKRCLPSSLVSRHRKFCSFWEWCWNSVWMLFDSSCRSFTPSRCFIPSRCNTPSSRSGITCSCSICCTCRITSSSGICCSMCCYCISSCSIAVRIASPVRIFGYSPLALSADSWNVRRRPTEVFRKLLSDNVLWRGSVGRYCLFVESANKEFV